MVAVVREIGSYWIFLRIQRMRSSLYPLSMAITIGIERTRATAMAIKNSVVNVTLIEIPSLILSC